MFPNTEIVNEIAAEMGIAPAFVEKDWYSVQVLKSVAEHQCGAIQTLFSGGTSLSKGYGLIQRFSEDLDFRCRYTNTNTGNQNKKIRSSYRESIISHIAEIEKIGLDKSNVKKASNYIKFHLDYPQEHDAHSSLRPNLQIEFSFTQPRLLPVLKPIKSLVSQFMNLAPETEILCLSPIETAADKLSALTWRVLKRDRNDRSDDPAMIRHLHDLSALSPVIKQDQGLFIKTANESFEEDRKAKNRDTQEAFYSSQLSALTQLQSDVLYRNEYQRFVDAMSYADDDSTIGFDHALDNLKEVASLFK